MTVEEFYREIRGDYDEVIKRLRKAEKIPRFVSMFLKDTNYAELKAAIEAEDTEAAFKAAHNLKGVSANLSLSELSRLASEITEALRGGDMAAAKTMLPPISENYNLIVKLSAELEA